MELFGGNRFSTTLRWMRIAFIPLALCFFAYSAYRSANQLGPILARLSVWHLAGAWICWNLAQIAGPLATAALARMRKLPFGYRDLALVSLLRIPARYLPGGIWHSVARFAAYGQMDISKRNSFTILVVEHLVALGVSVTIGSLLIIRNDGLRALHYGAPLLFVTAVVLLAATGWWAARNHGGARDKLRDILLLVVSVALFWSFAATSFCLYWTAIFHSSWSEVPRIASCYLLSWAAGFIAPFAPQGLGVFEWVASILLSPDKPISLNVTILAGFRVIVMASDLCVWAASLFYARWRQRV